MVISRSEVFPSSEVSRRLLPSRYNPPPLMTGCSEDALFSEGLHRKTLTSSI